MEEGDGKVIAEQLGRLADRIDARMQALETALKAHETLESERSANFKENVGELRKVAEDHESRIRTIGEATTRGQVVWGLASGGSGLAAILALLKAFLGGP